jgi:hypothetical protein
MTNLLIVAGVLAVITIAAYLIFNNKDKGQPIQTPSYTPEELENIKLAEELYNKDLRPIIAKKSKPQAVKEINVVEPESLTKESKPEFPIDKPKKKRKYYPKKKKQ